MTALPIAPAASVRLSPAAVAAIHRDPMDRFRTWLRDMAPGTRRSYEAGIRAFGSWLAGSDDPDEQVATVFALILGGDAGSVTAALVDWRDNVLRARPKLDAEGRPVLDVKGRPVPFWSAATINGKLTPVLSAIAHAAACGLVGYRVTKLLVPPARRCDRTGPSRDDVSDLLAACGDDAEGLRDAAMIRLAHNVGLRRHEVVGLDLASIDLDAADGAVAMVLGKGRREPEPVRLDPATATSIRRWLEARGPAAGPLFVRLDRARRSDLDRMTGEAFRLLLLRRAKRAKIRRPVRPHGLRHRGATEVAARRPSIAALKAWGRWQTIESARFYLDGSAVEQHAAAVAIAL